MKKSLLPLLFISLTACIYFGYINNNIAMGIMIIPLLSSLVFINLEMFERFKVGKEGIEAVLKEAQTTIDELRLLAISLSEPAIRNLAMTNLTFARMPIKTQIEMLDNLTSSLRELKIPKDKIEKLSEIYYERIYGGFRYKIITEMQNIAADIPTKNMLKNFSNEDSFKSSFPENYKELLLKNSLPESDLFKKLLFEFSYFIKNKQLYSYEGWEE